MTNRKLTKPDEVIAAMVVNNEELVVDGKLAYVGSRRVSASAVNALLGDMRLRLVMDAGGIEYYRLGQAPRPQ